MAVASHHSARETVPTEEVRAELTRILESPEFEAIPRRGKMLEFLVEEMLAGRGDRLKGYTVGVAVFGRGDDFDPNADPVVRIEAHRLRRDLDGYYMGSGQDSPLRISVPKGRYVPEFVQLSKPTENHSPAPVRVLEPVSSPSEQAKQDERGGLPRIVPAALLCIAIIASLGYVLWNTWSEKANGIVGVRPPSVAILPFEVLSGNQRDTYLASGIAHEIVSDLHRFPDIRVYSPRTSETDVRLDAAGTGRELGVTYVLDGSLRSENASIRINALLIETASGEVVWTNSYDRQLNPGPLLDAQNEIAEEIASALGQPFGVIKSEITARLDNQFLPSMSSYECVLRAYAYRRSFARELHAPVQSCLETAVARDPEYAEAWAMFAYMRLFSVVFRHVDPSEREVTYAAASEAASRAIAIDPDNVMGLKALGAINHYLGNYAESEHFARLAVERHPNDPDALIQLGWRLAIRGRFEEGVPLIEQAIERTPNPPGWYYHLLAINHLMQGDGNGMLLATERAAIDGSGVSESLLAMAHGLMGNGGAASQALNRLKEKYPGYDPVAVFRGHQAIDEILTEIIDALNKAGWTAPARQEAVN